jgi:phosphoadenosine phosphosulfate reductase
MNGLYWCKKEGIPVPADKCDKCAVCTIADYVTCGIYWCNSCNVPIIRSTNEFKLEDSSCPICGEKIKYVASDARIVFPEERLLVELLINEPFKFIDGFLINASGNRYIFNGQSQEIKIGEIVQSDPGRIIENYNRLKELNNDRTFTDNIEKFIAANRDRYNTIVDEADNFIEKMLIGYPLDSIFVSFSGGKDSTVVSHLVRKKMREEKILHIFGDTKLEMPFTYDYVGRFREDNPSTPLLTAKNNEKEFYEMCEIVGPPARLISWCCTVFKTSPINDIISVFFNDKDILTFYGIRRNESTSRSKYERDYESPKISKQKVVTPIYDWFDIDIWLYILTEKIDFNDAYRLGYARVGCWCCPNNSIWSEFMSKVYMPEKYQTWRNYLIDFANKIGKKDAAEYVDSGNWRKRQGGNGLEASKKIRIHSEPCTLEENAIKYELQRSITEDIYEVFKPFGRISKNMGRKLLNEVIVIDNATNEPIISIQGKPNQNSLKVVVLKTDNFRLTKQKIDSQITKYQMCIGCKGCEGVCKFDAIKVSDHKYIIDENKCVNCKLCISHFDGGCYMRKVLITRQVIEK